MSSSWLWPGCPFFWFFKVSAEWKCVHLESGLNKTPVVYWHLVARICTDFSEMHMFSQGFPGRDGADVSALSTQSPDYNHVVVFSEY